MGKTSLFLFVVVVASCGGSSRSTGSSGRNSGDDDSGGGSGGSMTGGKGGTNAGGKGGTSTPTGGSTTEGGSSGVAGTGGSLAGEPGADTGGSAGRGGSAGQTGGTGATGAMPSITSCTEEFPFVGEWEGSVLDFYFEALEDLRLVVTPDEELGGYQATITWGSGDPPPPVASGEEPYPSAAFWRGVDDIDPVSSIEPWPGFAYSVVRGAGCDEVFRVSVSVAEVWDEWCALQTPVYTEGQGWGCTLQGGGSSNSETCDVQDGNGRVLATHPLWMCSACGAYGTGVCDCDEAGCFFEREPTHTFEFELSTSGSVDVLSGPDPRCSDCTVRLERVE